MTTELSLEEKIAACPPALQTLIEDFRMAEPRERLELLVEFAMELPDLPDRLMPLRNQMEQVHECQSPVFLHTEIEDDQVHFYFDIPREAPTVRGYAGVLAEGLDGAPPAAVLATPPDVYMLLGLHEAITPQRLRGLHSLMIYMQRQVVKVESKIEE